MCFIYLSTPKTLKSLVSNIWRGLDFLQNFLVGGGAYYMEMSEEFFKKSAIAPSCYSLPESMRKIEAVSFSTLEAASCLHLALYLASLRLVLGR